MENKSLHPDTEDKGRGYWKNGKWCQSASTKKSNRQSRADSQIVYHRYTGREAVCDE